MPAGGESLLEVRGLRKYFPLRQPFLAHLGYGEGSLPHTEDVGRRAIAFPVTDATRPDEVAAIGDAVRAWARRTPLESSR